MHKSFSVLLVAALAIYGARGQTPPQQDGPLVSLNSNTNPLLSMAFPNIYPNSAQDRADGLIPTNCQGTNFVTAQGTLCGTAADPFVPKGFISNVSPAICGACDGLRAWNGASSSASQCQTPGVAACDCTFRKVCWGNTAPTSTTCTNNAGCASNKCFSDCGTCSGGTNNGLGCVNAAGCPGGTCAPNTKPGSTFGQLVGEACCLTDVGRLGLRFSASSSANPANKGDQAVDIVAPGADFWIHLPHVIQPYEAFNGEITVYKYFVTPWPSDTLVGFTLEAHDVSNLPTPDPNPVSLGFGDLSLANPQEGAGTQVTFGDLSFPFAVDPDGPNAAAIGKNLTLRVQAQLTGNQRIGMNEMGVSIQRWIPGTAAPPPPPPAVIICDPEFVGFNGQRYDVQGKDGAVYNLLSDEHVQLNAKMVDPGCSHTAGKTTRTVLGEAGFKYMDHQVWFSAEGEATFNGEAMELNKIYSFNEDSEEEYAQLVQQGRHNKRVLQIETPGYAINLEASSACEGKSHRIDAVLAKYDLLAEPHGLIGMSSRNPHKTRALSTGQHGEGVLIGTLDKYELSSGDVFGDDFHFNQFTGLLYSEEEMSQRSVGIQVASHKPLPSAKSINEENLHKLRDAGLL